MRLRKDLLSVTKMSWVRRKILVAWSFWWSSELLLKVGVGLKVGFGCWRPGPVDISKSLRMEIVLPLWVSVPMFNYLSCEFFSYIGSEFPFLLCHCAPRRRA